MASREIDTQPDPFTIAQMQRPKTSWNVITFPFELGRFSTEEFDEAKTEGKVTNKDVEQVINSLKESKYYKPLNNKWLSRIMVLGLVVVFLPITIGISLGAQFVLGDNIFLLIIAIFAAFLAVTWCINYCFASAYKNRERYLMDRETDFERRLEDLNDTDFAAREVSWIAGRYGAWVCLKLHFLPDGDEDYGDNDEFLKTGVLRTEVDPFEAVDTNRSDYNTLNKKKKNEESELDHDVSYEKDADGSDSGEVSSEEEPDTATRKGKKATKLEKSGVDEEEEEDGSEEASSEEDGDEEGQEEEDEDGDEEEGSGEDEDGSEDGDEEEGSEEDGSEEEGDDDESYEKEGEEEEDDDDDDE